MRKIPSIFCTLLFSLGTIFAQTAPEKVPMGEILKQSLASTDDAMNLVLASKIAKNAVELKVGVSHYFVVPVPQDDFDKFKYSTLTELSNEYVANYINEALGFGRIYPYELVENFSDGKDKHIYAKPKRQNAGYSIADEAFEKEIRSQIDTDAKFFLYRLDEEKTNKSLGEKKSVLLKIARNSVEIQKKQKFYTVVPVTNGDLRKLNEIEEISDTAAAELVIYELESADKRSRTQNSPNYAIETPNNLLFKDFAELSESPDARFFIYDFEEEKTKTAFREKTISIAKKIIASSEHEIIDDAAYFSFKNPNEKILAELKGDHDEYIQGLLTREYVTECFSEALDDKYEDFHEAKKAGDDKTDNWKIICKDTVATEQYQTKKAADEKARLEAIQNGKNILAHLGITIVPSGTDKAEVTVEKKSPAGRKMRSGTMDLKTISLNIDEQFVILSGFLCEDGKIIPNAEITLDDFFIQVSKVEKTITLSGYLASRKAIVLTLE